MHVADALVSPPIALTAGVASAALIGIASKKVSKISRPDLVPLMGVLGAFVFAAQMINFAIPGTGSSGHIIGGVLLAALIGPWAGFITLTSVLIIQCLIFADGGLLALGCNIINMGALSTLVAFPLIYRPIVRHSLSKARIMWAAVLSCVVGLELGAIFVTLETELSGITALPTVDFLLFMLPIHFVIGICEGIATGIVICFVASYKPDILYDFQSDGLHDEDRKINKRKYLTVLGVFIVLAVVFGIGFTWIASENPDGLEWSIQRITGSTELAPAVAPPTAVMPDYDSTFSGIIGALIVVALLWGICAILFRKKRQTVNQKV